MNPIQERNFTTVSPSAKMLLLMKGYTQIPFAKEAAELIMAPEKYERNYQRKDLSFWLRTVHLESRYQSLDQLLDGLNIKNILELSSGFSFRSLEAAKQPGIYYIDTDLPGIIDTKKQMISHLSEGVKLQGKLELEPLNALDENRFKELVARFPAGPIAIINEGLLMYLELEEKEKLCKIIHDVLKERGGYWITADIYIRSQTERIHIYMEDEMQRLLREHNVDQKRFESFEAAEEFFKRMGFIKDKVAKINRSKLTSLPYLIKNLSFWKLLKLRRAKIQATWRLKVAE